MVGKLAGKNKKAPARPMDIGVAGSLRRPCLGSIYPQSGKFTGNLQRLG
jgi:hypothetical protein